MRRACLACAACEEDPYRPRCVPLELLPEAELGAGGCVNERKSPWDGTCMLRTKVLDSAAWLCRLARVRRDDFNALEDSLLPLWCRRNVSVTFW